MARTSWSYSLKQSSARMCSHMFFGQKSEHILAQEHTCHREVIMWWPCMIVQLGSWKTLLADEFGLGLVGKCFCKAWCPLEFEHSLLLCSTSGWNSALLEPCYFVCKMVNQTCIQKARLSAKVLLHSQSPCEDSTCVWCYYFLCQRSLNKYLSWAHQK